MRSTNFALAAVLALAAPLASATAAPGTFRLPPEQSTQQPPPDRQGPVAPDVPESRRPAPTPTPTASATVPESTPAIVPPPVSITAPTGVLTQRTPAPAPRVVAPSVTPTPAPIEAGAAEPTPLATTGAAASSPSIAAPTPVAAAAREGSPIWPWIAAALALLAGLALAGWLWLRVRPVIGAAAVPEIERPQVAPEPAAEPAPAAAATGEPLQVALEPLSLSLTLMNATLAYRLEIANRGLQPLTGLVIGADMISAHASMTREEQLSGPDGRAAVQRIERLEPGESRLVEGEFRVPFSQIVPIRQGKAALLLPLARFRVEAEGAGPVVRTFAVGQPGNGQSLQPFRLDQGPRVYPTLTQHAFA